jgi:signal transduction histidine kinase
LPLVVHGQTVGALGMHFIEERAFDPDDRSFIGTFAEQAGLALERARLFEAERRARTIAERLQSVTAALSEAITPDQVTDIVLTAGLQALGAGAGVITMLRENEPILEVLKAVGFSQALVEPYRTMRLDQQVPMTEAIRAAEPIWIANAEEWAARFPALHQSAATSPFRAWAAIPFIIDGKPRGAMGLSFHHEHAIAVEQREFMLALTRQCSQALERARLFDAEQRARREAAAGQERAELLAEFSRQLGSSLDYNATLESVATGTVPRLADWCAVDMLADLTANSWPPAVKRLAVMHSDPAKIQWARELRERQPQDWSAPTGLPRVFKDGTTEFFPVITDDLLVASAKSDEELALLREIGFTAYICVPLKVSGRTVGAITLVMADSKRHYTDADVALAEELATRASLAIENAELFREAQHANAAKAQFLAVMSHELRTPLNAIGGYAELLELGVRGELNVEQLHDIHRIQRSQHHLLALINDVLNFARIEAGHVQYNIGNVDLSDVLDEVVSLMAPQATARQVSVRVEECAADSVAVADSEKVQQVLRNLLSNAVKFTMPGGRVTLSCEARKDTIDLRVSDSGIGIPADRLQAIFDPFVQVQSGLTRSSEGTGLGLSISRDLARGMRGDLRVESVLGSGSTFTLTLPRRGAR